MDRQAGRAHYVRHNKVTRVPRTHIYLDAEAHIVESGPTQRQYFRLAVAACDRQRHDRYAWADRQWIRAHDEHSLWAWIDARTSPKARTILAAHNLAYDLRITGAFDELPALGWTLKAIRLNGGQAWASWKRGDRTLVMVDTLAWVPTNLGRLGELVGLRKLDLPDQSASDEVWMERCVRDVEILAAVWRRLVTWVREEDLGNWKPTGAGQAWAAFRHRFMAHPLLVHEDDDARAAERAAAHTGRCEAWRHGLLRHGPYTEWDATCAYATIGRDHPVPTRLHGELHRPTLADLVGLFGKARILAEVEVRADQPTVPVRTPKGIVWPVGTFRTVLWDCEMELALAEGAELVPGRAWWYKQAPALHAFCSWVLDGIDGDKPGVDQVIALAKKHWSRALIGRMAASWPKWETWGESPTLDLVLGKYHDAATGSSGQFLQVGHQLLRSSEARENPDALVSIMSWIMARARVNLWHAMRAAGLDHVVYVDTDSLIVDREGSERLRKTALAGLRPKGSWSSVEVLGPRQLELSGQLRAAGVPSGATKVEDRVWRGQVWDGLGASLASGRPTQVKVTDRTFRLHGVDHRRVHYFGGGTGPVRVDSEAAAESA